MSTSDTMADPEQRNWEELPRDVLYKLFQILGAVEILLSVQRVCRSWRQLALEPDLWRCINLRYKRSPLIDDTIADKLARVAIDRSCGNVKRFSVELCTPTLRTATDRVSYEGIVEFVRRCPTLEELEINDCCYYKEAYGDVGRALPELRCFRLNKKYIEFPPILGFNRDYDGDAVTIASSMHQLRELQLVGNLLTTRGLLAILDNCLHLESLDIRCCFNVNMDHEGQKAKLAKIKNVKLPDDSNANYAFDTRMEPAEEAELIRKCLLIYVSSVMDYEPEGYYNGYDEE